MINVVTITITHAPSSLLCQNEDDFGFKYIYTFLIFTKGPVTKFNVKAAAPCQSVKCVLRFCMSCVLKNASLKLSHFVGKQFGKCISGVFAAQFGKYI